MRIDVSGHQFVFPTTCACCGGHADTVLTVSASKSSGKTTVHNKSHAWDIPYCTGCMGHIRAAEKSREVAGVLVFWIIIAAAVLWYFTTPYLGIPIGILGLIGTAILYNKLQARAKASCVAGCVHVGKAATYLGWHGTLHKFDFLSKDFALAFMVSNQRKLVNLLPEASDLLSSSGSVPKPNAPRSARRFMK